MLKIPGCSGGDSQNEKADRAGSDKAGAKISNRVIYWFSSRERGEGTCFVSGSNCKRARSALPGSAGEDGPSQRNVFPGIHDAAPVKKRKTDVRFAQYMR